ncbi:adenylyltransferase/cytidyltransferase family protein [Candidatus Micrarchaeota archaeon]|nr:adenylyltransferase/cytidyltransferase family protein [Candidatus Micrarchaeota archaeon]
MKDLIKKLYYLQIKNWGIPPSDFEKFSQEEKQFLEPKESKYFLKNPFKKQIKIVATGGVFDILHIGHLYTLNEAKKHGDFLVVIIARDDMIRKKNRKPIHSQDYRAKMVESLKPVDCAILGIEEPTKTLEFLKPDIIVYGYDQKDFLRPEGIQIIKLDKHLEEQKFKTHKIIEELGL